MNTLRFYNEVTVEYHFFGQDLDKEKIEKAVDLSVTRYCGVMEMFRGFSKVKNGNKIQLELLAEIHKHINDSRISFDEAEAQLFY